MVERRASIGGRKRRQGWGIRVGLVQLLPRDYGLLVGVLRSIRGDILDAENE
jgi:hypothetical protein